MGHCVSRGLRRVLIVRRTAQYCELETLDSLRALGTYRESVLSGPDCRGPLLRLVIGSPFAAQVHVLDLSSSLGNPGLRLCCYTYAQPVGVNIRAARDSSCSACVLLRLGLSARDPLLRPTANYCVVLCVGGLFSRCIAGSKRVQRGPTKGIR